MSDQDEKTAKGGSKGKKAQSKSTNLSSEIAQAIMDNLPAVVTMVQTQMDRNHEIQLQRLEMETSVTKANVEKLVMETREASARTDKVNIDAERTRSEFRVSAARQYKDLALELLESSKDEDLTDEAREMLTLRASQLLARAVGVKVPRGPAEDEAPEAEAKAS